MAVIRIPQSYTGAWIANSTREALMTVGEELILLHAYHYYVDEETTPRCTCFSAVYEQSATWQCPHCYGTTFLGGIKESWRVWGIFADHPIDETYSKQGMWTADDRSVQIEAEPAIMRHDFLIRVMQWDNLHQPVSYGDRYIVGEVTQLSLRTGSQYGQQDNHSDSYGQKANLHRLPENHPIQQYTVPLGPIARIDSFPR
jgi:hypothetical protein